MNLLFLRYQQFVRPLLLIFFLTSLSTAGASEDRLPTIDDIRKTDQTPVKIQATGQRESLEQKVNGVIQGKARYYHPNGQLYTVITYKDGQKTGSHTLFREDGTKDQEINYKNDQYDGTIRWFDQSGKLYFEATYDSGKLLTRRDLRAPEKTEPKTLMDKTFDRDLSILELIAIATKPSQKSNEMENIKRHAYKLLLIQWEQNVKSDQSQICAAQSKYITDWKTETSSWLRVSTAKVIATCDTTKDIPLQTLAEVILFLAEEVEFSGLDREERKRAERPIITALAKLPMFSNAKQNQKSIRSLIELMSKQIYSNQVIASAAQKLDQLLKLNEKQGGLDAKSKTIEIEHLAKQRFAMQATLDEHYKQYRANQPNGAHTVTIWDFATEDEVKATLNHLDKITCSVRPNTALSNWIYSYVVIGRSESGFKDSVKELSCKI